MVTEIREDVGVLDPRFDAANRSFTAKVSVPDGVLTRLDYYPRGTHTTNITTAQQDGEFNFFTHLQMTINRKRGKPVVWNMLPRDLKHLTSIWEGQLPARANPATAGQAHFGLFSHYLAPPRHLLGNPLMHGIDTREIVMPIIVEGQYGPLTSIGAGVTAVDFETQITAVVRKRIPGRFPRLVWSGNQMRQEHESAQRQGPKDVSVGNIEFLYGMLIRTFDVSLPATDRIDGFLTRVIVRHSRLRDLVNELWAIQKKATGMFYQLAAADIPAGVILPTFAGRANRGDLLPLNGETLQIILDSLEVPPDEFPDVVPVAGDAVFINTLGAQATTLRPR